MDSELELAWKNAWSRQPQNPDPSELRYIGTITRGTREYIFYKDKQGNYWYDSKAKGVKCTHG
jgi:hypothetical protein